MVSSPIDSSTTCMRGGNFKAYKIWKHGVLTYFKYKITELYEIISLENINGIMIMSYGEREDYHELKITSSVFVAEVHPGALCPSGFDDCTIVCAQQDSIAERSGIWLTTSTEEGKEYPLTSTDQWDQVVSHSLFNVDVSIQASTFRNFIPREQNCFIKQNAILTHEYIADYYPIHYFLDNIFENVDADSLVYLKGPLPEWEEVKRCGDYECSGPNNILLYFENTQFLYEEDISESLLPNQMNEDSSSFQIISNNPGINYYLSDCTFKESWNGLFCENDKLQLLELESTDLGSNAISRGWFTRPDGFLNEMNSGLMFLLDSSSYGLSSSPLIISKYPGIIESDTSYSISFEGSAPYNMGVHLNSPSPSSSSWTILEISYDRALSLSTWVDNIEKLPMAWYLEFLPSECGDNAWDPTLNTLSLYLTKDCSPLIQTLDSVQFSIRLSMTADQFLSSDGPTVMVDALANALGIQFSRIRVVGVRSGSVYADGQIICEQSLVQQSDREEELQQVYDDIVLVLQSNEIVFFEGVQLLDFTVELAVIQAQEDQKDSEVLQYEDGLPLVVNSEDSSFSHFYLCAIVAISLIIVIIIIAIIIIRKRNKSTVKIIVSGSSTTCMVTEDSEKEMSTGGGMVEVQDSNTVKEFKVVSIHCAKKSFSTTHLRTPMKFNTGGESTRNIIDMDRIDTIDEEAETQQVTERPLNKSTE